MDKWFQKQYRIESSRLTDWDYTNAGMYFVTICTYYFKCYFGEIKNEVMHLNQAGEIAKSNWIEIPSHHNNVILDAFVIMPNHIHGILILIDNENNVETLHATSLQNELDADSNFFSSISPKKDSLSTIIRSYKSSVTRTLEKTLRPISPGSRGFTTILFEQNRTWKTCGCI